MRAHSRLSRKKEGIASARASLVRRKDAKTGETGNHRVFLVADRPVIRASLVLVLKKAGFELVGQAESRKEALAHPGLALADVVIVSFLSGDDDALGLVKALRARGLRSAICSISGDSAQVQRAFAVGANGYVTQGDEPEHLFEAVRVVASGRNYVSPRAGAGLARKISGLENPAPEDELSKQQWQVYELLGKGESTDEIAMRVRISPRTVETYCYRMIEKLDLFGMKALRRHAIAHGSKSFVWQSTSASSRRRL